MPTQTLLRRFHPRGLARTLPLICALGTLGAAPASAQLPAVYSTPGQFGPFMFSASQLTRLSAAGCAFGSEDQAAAARLAFLRFRAADFVNAYELYARAGRPTGVSFEWIARYAFLKLPEADLVGAAKADSLTDYYNRRIGGKGLMIAGWVMTGVGVVPLGFGIAGWVYGTGSCVAAGGGGLGAALGCVVLAVLGVEGMVVGGGLIVAGIPMGVVGTQRVNSWLPPTLLDTGTANEVSPYRAEGTDGAPPGAGQSLLDVKLVSPVATLSGSPGPGSSMGGLQFSF